MDYEIKESLGWYAILRSGKVIAIFLYPEDAEEFKDTLEAR